MTANDIIKSSRYRLGDTDKTGWADNRLLELVDAAQKDLCKQSGIYRKNASLGFSNYKELYALPTDCHEVTRIEHQDVLVPIYSREDLDIISISTDIPFVFIKSNLDMGIIEISPTVEDLEERVNMFIGTEYEAEEFTFNSPLGVIVDLDGINEYAITPELGEVASFLDELDDSSTKNQQFGDICGWNVVTNIEADFQTLDPEDDPTHGVVVNLNFTTEENMDSYGFLTSLGGYQLDGEYGICTDVLLQEESFEVFYNAIPSMNMSLYAALVVPDIWKQCLVHYVVGMARQDDNDEGNWQLGEQEILKYQIEVGKAKASSSKSFNKQISGVRETNYRGRI